MAIDGVRVLAQEVIKEIPNFVFVIAGFIVGCMILFLILSLITKRDWAMNTCIIVGFIGFLWMIIAGGCGIFNKPSNRNTYKCIFEGNVSIQEIYEKYDVVGRDGEIWILEDKE